MSDRNELLQEFPDNTARLIQAFNVRDFVNSAVLPQDITAGSGIIIASSGFPTSLVISSIGSGATSLDQLTDVQVTDADTTIGYALRWDGTAWIAASPTGSLAFACHLEANVNGVYLVGTGQWVSAYAIDFTASYSNGNPTSAYIVCSQWSETLSSPFTSGNNPFAMNYTNPGSGYTFTLNASSGSQNASSAVEVIFDNNIYYGTTLNAGPFTQTDIDACTAELSNSVDNEVTVTANTGYYVLYAIPERLGTLDFWVNGFQGGFLDPQTLNVSNSNGYSENYYIYRSTNSGLGTIQITTTAGV
jgi:hypothetical protein